MPALLYSSWSHPMPLQKLKKKKCTYKNAFAGQSSLQCVVCNTTSDIKLVVCTIIHTLRAYEYVTYHCTLAICMYVCQFTMWREMHASIVAIYSGRWLNHIFLP